VEPQDGRAFPAVDDGGRDPDGIAARGPVEIELEHEVSLRRTQVERALGVEGDEIELLGAQDLHAPRELLQRKGNFSRLDLPFLEAALPLSEREEGLEGPGRLLGFGLLGSHPGAIELDHLEVADTGADERKEAPLDGVRSE
jgi:hypothetical protein